MSKKLYSSCRFWHSLICLSSISCCWNGGIALLIGTVTLDIVQFHKDLLIKSMWADGGNLFQGIISTKIGWRNGLSLQPLEIKKLLAWFNETIGQYWLVLLRYSFGYLSKVELRHLQSKPWFKTVLHTRYVYSLLGPHILFLGQALKLESQRLFPWHVFAKARWHCWYIDLTASPSDNQWCLIAFVLIRMNSSFWRMDDWDKSNKKVKWQDYQHECVSVTR